MKGNDYRSVGKPPTHTIAAVILAQSPFHQVRISPYEYGLLVQYTGPHGKTNQTLPSDLFMGTITLGMIKQYLFAHRVHLQRTGMQND